jgi:hypothetical protein
MDVQNGAPVLVGHLVDKAVPRHTGVVDQDVQTPVALDRLPNSVLDLGAVRDIHPLRERVHALVNELPRRRKSSLQLRVGQANPRPLPRETSRRGLAYPPRSPRHHRNPAIKTAQRRSFQSLSTLRSAGFAFSISTFVCVRSD